MVLSFETEFANYGAGERLPPQWRREFYEKMRHSVVRAFNEEKIVDPNISAYRREGSGVIVHNNGLILTASHLLKDDNRLKVQYFDEEEELEATVLHSKPEWDVAVLLVQSKLDPNDDEKFVDFCSTKDITVGSEVFAITHPESFIYTLGVGHVSYPADCVSYIGPEGTSASTRYVSTINFTPVCWLAGQLEDEVLIKKLSLDLPLVHVTNTHGLSGSSGGPVFNSRGKIVGLLCHSDGIYNYLIHAEALREFVGDCVEKFKALPH